MISAFSAMTIFFIACIIWIFGKLLYIGIHAAWGMAHFLLAIVFLPAILVGMFVSGLMYAAIALALIFAIIIIFL